MTLSIPDALRAMAWLLVPRHFYAVYAACVIIVALALVGAVTLGVLAFRRIRGSLAALALGAAVGSAPPSALTYLPRYSSYRQHRVVHAAHPPRTGADVPNPAAIDRPAPQHRIHWADAAQLRALPSMDEQLERLADEIFIGPLEEACRQDAARRAAEETAQ